MAGNLLGNYILLLLMNVKKKVINYSVPVLWSPLQVQLFSRIVPATTEVP